MFLVPIMSINPNGVPIVNTKIPNSTIPSLLGTGANYSVTDSKLAEKLCPKSQNGVEMLDRNGNKFKPVGKVSLNLQIGINQIMVMEKLLIPCIIGADIIEKQNIVIQINQNKFYPIDRNIGGKPKMFLKVGIPTRRKKISSEKIQRKVRKMCGDVALASFDYEKPIVLKSETSQIGCGATRMNRVDGRDRPITFVSKRFKKSEINAQIYEKRAFAISRTYQKLKEFLRGHKLSIQTDCSAVQIVKTPKDKKTKNSHGALGMSSWAIEILLVKESMNVEAETLSFVPVFSVPEEVTWFNESRKMVYTPIASLFDKKVPKETSTKEQRNDELCKEITAHRENSKTEESKDYRWIEGSVKKRIKFKRLPSGSETFQEIKSYEDLPELVEMSLIGRMSKVLEVSKKTSNEECRKMDSSKKMEECQKMDSPNKSVLGTANKIKKQGTGLGKGVPANRSYGDKTSADHQSTQESTKGRTERRSSSTEAGIPNTRKCTKMSETTAKQYGEYFVPVKQSTGLISLHMLDDSQQQGIKERPYQKIVEKVNNSLEPSEDLEQEPARPSRRLETRLNYRTLAGDNTGEISLDVSVNRST